MEKPKAILRLRIAFFMMKIDEKQLVNEIDYKAVLSSGPGGQHANKTSTKVILEWEMESTKAFSEKLVQRLKRRLKTYITKDGVMQLSCDETRSQHRNKKIVYKRFLHLISTNLKPIRKRKRTRPGKKFHRKRLEDKKQNAEKKARRKDPLK